MCNPASLHVASAPATVTGEGANSREKSGQEEAALGGCRGFSPWAAPAGTSRWFGGQGRVLANLAAWQRHRQQFPRVSASASWDTGGKAPPGFLAEVAHVCGQIAASRLDTWPRWPGQPRTAAPGASPALLSRGTPRGAAGEASVSEKSLGKGGGRRFGGRVGMVPGRKAAPSTAGLLSPWPLPTATRAPCDAPAWRQPRLRGNPQAPTGAIPPPPRAVLGSGTSLGVPAPSLCPAAQGGKRGCPGVPFALCGRGMAPAARAQSAALREPQGWWLCSATCWGQDKVGQGQGRTAQGCDRREVQLRGRTTRLTDAARVLFSNTGTGQTSCVLVAPGPWVGQGLPCPVTSSGLLTHQAPSLHPATSREQGGLQLFLPLPAHSMATGCCPSTSRVLEFTSSLRISGEICGWLWNLSSSSKASFCSEERSSL